MRGLSQRCGRKEAPTEQHSTQFHRLSHLESRPRSAASVAVALAIDAAAAFAQIPPTILSEPASQTAVVGSTVVLRVTASGPGPLTYQWVVNGTNLPSGVITTVAGDGTEGFSGDGGPATNTSLASPSGLALDSVGNLFLADTGNNRVRRVGVDGVISTIAGDGTQGFSGDGGPATAASLANPSGIALDLVGNLVIADTWNNCIRRVGTNGIITTIAGNGSQGYAGDGGAATAALLTSPTAVALDAAGNLFIADSWNNRVRKVDTNGLISTVAGNGTAGYSADGGAATNASLKSPNGLAVDVQGNLFIADAGNNRIRKVDARGIITTVAGTGQFTSSGDGGAATNASLADPVAVAVDPVGNLFIADQYSYRVRTVDTNGIIWTAAGNGAFGYSGDGDAATNASLANPVAVALDASGNLFIADTGNSRVRQVTLLDHPALAFLNLTAANAGDYRVVVSNPYGSVTSAVANVTVVAPPTITTQPASQLAQPGATVSFEVSVAGTGPFAYQWQFNGTNLSETIVTNLWRLTLTNVSSASAGDYQVAVSNAYGSVISAVATLTVASPPTITLQPASQTVSAGGTVRLQVTAAGVGPFSYQWQFNGTNLPGGIITTIAGGGVGDGGPATNAVLWQPTGVAWDAAGNPIIADSGDSRIRRVNVDGTIITLAGNGRSGYSGDGGPATEASLNYPAGVVADGSGNLFIADGYNNVVRKLAPDGSIQTVAGTGRWGYFGDGGPATNATLANVASVALDSAGDLFIADAWNNCIRRVGTDGIISTVAGKGTSGYSGDGGAATNASLANPAGIAVDLAGNLFITDSYNSRIRKVDPNGIITTVAGNGRYGYAGDSRAATNASLANPSSVAVDSAGNLFIADSGNNRIRQVDTNGVIHSVAGTGQYGYTGDGGAATKAMLANPAGVAVDNFGNLLITDPSNNFVRKVSTNGIITTIAGNKTSRLGDGGPATNATLRNPVGLALDTAGNLFVADSGNARVREVRLDHTIITVAGTGQFGYAGDGGLATNASLGNPTALAVDATGNVFIAEGWGSRVRMVNTNGIIRTVAGRGQYGYSGDGLAATNASLANPSGLAVDSAGNLFIADSGNNRIRQVNPAGIITTIAGNGVFGYSGDGGAATNASIANPSGLAVDKAGNLFIADSSNGLIRRIDPAGIISTVAGDGQWGYSGDGGAATNASLANPVAVAVDDIGNLFIAEQANNRIRRVGLDGLIATVAGDGSYGASGDGAAATNASLASPSAVAVRGSGDLFIADTQNSRIRHVLVSDFAVLVLVEVTPVNAGDYQVTISNPFGNVTSVVATVTLAAPAVTLNVRGGSAILLQLTGHPGGSYLLQGAGNLTPPVMWQPLVTNTADANGYSSYLDTNLAGVPTRFYRAQEVP